jgi:hypothetical protein
MEQSSFENSSLDDIYDDTSETSSSDCDEIIHDEEVASTDCLGGDIFINKKLAGKSIITNN